ncbi:CDP-2,3-bis-(O-geranylgeranyl)-sn-glycerol synthase [Candidatus Bathyarchaeota archaeon]|nr:CDP-2,3-bis-(O-geranylgeranyl)-sn-glycerol synthase [Candidatus Bathyarchaeota archaeon]
MEFTGLIIEAIKFIFPAYCANAIPVIAGGGCPIDFGKNFYDGKPIFGKNKTFRGFLSGLTVGTLIGFIETIFSPQYPFHFGFLLSLGALIGDLAGSFVKRRFGLKPGALLPVVDQVDFIVGALLFSFPFFFKLFTVQFVVIIFAITIPLHLITNFIAYKLGLKKHPW